MNRRSLFAGLLAAPVIVPAIVKAAASDERIVGRGGGGGNQMISLRVAGMGSISVEDFAQQLADGIRDGGHQALRNALLKG